MPQIRKEYIETGKVKYVVLDFPLESIHPQAFKAAEATHCAREQDAFWDMHARLFANQKALDTSALLRHAETLGLEMPAFRQCLESGKYASRIRQDMAVGRQVGVTGTPSFFLGFTDSNGSTVKAVRALRGAQPYAQFQGALDSLLAVENN